MDKEQSNLMLSDEEICSKILHCGKSNIETCRKLEQRCDYLYDIKSGIRAELDHLAGLGIVYVKVQKDCPMDGESMMPLSICREVHSNICSQYSQCANGYTYIPLSDYKG